MSSLSENAREVERLLRQACAELDRRRRQGEDAKVETFFQQYPLLTRNADAAIELIYTELVLREELGETVRAEDYYRRFPQFSDRLRKLLAVHDGLPQWSKHPTQAIQPANKPAPAAGPPTAIEKWTAPLNPAMLPLGFRLGQYEIVNPLGRGGSGVVYLGRSLKTHKMVAIKMILEGHWAGADLVSRFQSEARVLSRLHHPNIVQIYEVAQWQGLPYFVMEYVGGGSLADRMTGQPIAPRAAARMIASLARAIQLAHNQGVVHRDIKPGNILLVGGLGPAFANPQEPAGKPQHEAVIVAKLTDFGLAKFMDEAGTLEVARRQPTRTGAIIGTPSYMAPEQASGRNRDVSAATDVYALGAVLYECLTGRPPFQGATYIDTLEQVRNEEPISIRRLQPQIPHDLETICLKCLQKSPSKRYERAADLAADLERYTEGQQIQARPIGYLDRAMAWCIKKPVHATMAGAIVMLTTLIILGAIMAIFRLDHARQRADAAKQEALHRLWEANVSQARVFQLSHQAGRRYRALELLREAALLRPDPSLRDEVIACLTLLDVRVRQSWPLGDEAPEWTLMHPNMEWFARHNTQGGFDLCQISDQAVVRRLAVDRNHVFTHLAFSPDGRFFVCLARDRELLSGRCLAWEVTSGRKVIDAVVPAQVAQVGFTNDRRGIVCPMPDQSLAVLEAATGQTLLQHKNLGPVERIACQPHGTLWAVVHGPERWVGLRDSHTGRLNYRIPTAAGTTAVQWSHDGRWLVLGHQDKTASIWEMPQTAQQQPRLIIRLAGHDRAVTAARFSPTGRWLLTISGNGMTTFWSTATWQKEIVIRGSAMQVSPDESQVGFRDGRSMGFWEIGMDSLAHAYKMPSTTLPSAGLPLQRLGDLSFSPDGSMLAAASLRGVQIFDCDQRQEVALLPTDQAGTAQFHASGQSLLTFGRRGVHLWNLAAQRDRHEVVINGPTLLHEPLIDAAPYRAAFSPNGKEVAVLDPLRGQLILLQTDAASSREIMTIMPQGRSLAWHPREPWLVCGHAQGRGIGVYDRRTKSLLQHLGKDAFHSNDVEAIFAPGTGHLIVNMPQRVDCYQCRSWQRFHSFPRGEMDQDLGVAAFSPGGRLSAFTLQPRKILIHHWETGQNLISLTLPEFNEIQALAFSHDDRFLAALTDAPNVYVWDLEKVRGYMEAFGLAWPPLPPGSTVQQPLEPNSKKTYRVQPSVPATPP